MTVSENSKFEKALTSEIQALGPEAYEIFLKAQERLKGFRRNFFYSIATGVFSNFIGAVIVLGYALPSVRIEYPFLLGGIITLILIHFQEKKLPMLNELLLKDLKEHLKKKNSISDEEAEIKIKNIRKSLEE